MFCFSFVNVCLDFLEFFELFFIFWVHHNSSSFEVSAHTVMSLRHSTYAVLLRRWRPTEIVCMAMLQLGFLCFMILRRHQSHSTCPPLLEHFLHDFTLADTFLVKGEELSHLKILLVLKSVICCVQLSCTRQHQLLCEIKCVYVCFHGHCWSSLWIDTVTCMKRRDVPAYIIFKGLIVRVEPSRLMST
jgi:hypothetical protein